MTELPTFPNPINGKAHQAETAGESASATRGLRHDWQKSEVVALLTQPLLDLVDQAREVHRRHHADGTVQLASLYSIKTGACPEDCKYCPQSAHYAKSTGLKREEALDVDEVLSKAAIAKEAGATRFCMGAAWREVKDGEAFDRVLAMVRGVRALDMEACVTLGMLNQSQADRLAEAGLTAYNHNLDTSAEFYGEIITTRCYQDRLDTLAARAARRRRGLLRRHHRHGRKHRGPRRAAPDARQSRSASRKRADQRACRRAGHAAARPAADRSARPRAHGGDCAAS